MYQFLLRITKNLDISRQGVEKNNDDAKKIYFQKSNRWDGARARDVLLVENRQQLLSHCEREKRQYHKRNAAYWENDIIETRKKQTKACLREIQINHSASVEQGSNSSENKYKKDLKDFIRIRTFIHKYTKYIKYYRKLNTI
jgi:hypothetical protein